MADWWPLQFHRTGHTTFAAVAEAWLPNGELFFVSKLADGYRIIPSAETIGKIADKTKRSPFVVSLDVIFDTKELFEVRMWLEGRLINE